MFQSELQFRSTVVFASDDSAMVILHDHKTYEEDINLLKNVSRPIFNVSLYLSELSTIP